MQFDSDDSIVVSAPQLADTESAAIRLAEVCAPPFRIYLRGELGVGKTTFARAFLRGGGVNQLQKIPSPSFSLLESYDADGVVFHHFDFFRFAHEGGGRGWIDAGFDEYLRGNSVCLIEWPDRAAGLPPPDISLSIEWPELSSRRLIFSAVSGGGKKCLRAFSSR